MIKVGPYRLQRKKCEVAGRKRWMGDRDGGRGGWVANVGAVAELRPPVMVSSLDDNVANFTSRTLHQSRFSEGLQFPMPIGWKFCCPVKYRQSYPEFPFRFFLSFLSYFFFESFLPNFFLWIIFIWFLSFNHFYLMFSFESLKLNKQERED